MAKALAEPMKARETSVNKRDSIVEGAGRVFLACGFVATSMDTIAAESGVSKQTIYSHFGSKDALFEAIVRQKCDEMMEPVAQSELRGDEPQEVLRSIARRFLLLILDPANTRLFKAIVAESERFPDLAKTFYRSGPRAVSDQLAAYLTEQHREGVLWVPDPKASGELFFALMRADQYIRSILSITQEPGTDKIERHVDHAVEVFLAAHALVE